MPGHVKLGAKGEPDPDPAPYLIVSNEMKREAMAKPYDSKKSVWCPDGEGGFVEGLLDNDDGKKATVVVGHEKKSFKSELVGPVNPPKFEKCEDMANLTFLNEASVFWNLKTRYQAKLIYTYSGLFCVVVNPYKRFPIYTPTVVKLYLGKRRNEVPPHLWAITETAYRNMLVNGKDQSMLITGESGAGKTENTKKVISYLAMVASSGKKADKKVSLEDQIVATNPILESYGNAKTSRNDNSSRFGKFIRIHFNTSGKLSGCDIQSYLLEKSRITQQQEVERSYHIFYQLLQPFVADLKAKCLLTDDIYDYSYVSQGKTTVASIDDNEELEYTDDAFNVIGFSDEEKWNCYMLTAAVMTMGEIRFKQKPRDEQCEPDTPEINAKVANLCGVDCEAMMKAYVKPRIKVGTEWVTKGQNIDQATNAVGGIARGLYSRLFNWLIDKCNDTLIDKSMKKVNFCAVLDIAGFEIFEYNGYEQISINFVNEKLQQFFNHHMFVVEQEEYVSEGIDWVMVDFGMDLAACIIMFEKPMGVWAIIEEESLFPKATDKTLEEKLKSTHLGKSPPFAKPQSKTDKNAHFAIVHYAGTVSYNVTGWLVKNKDPVNDTVVDILKKSPMPLLVHLWREHPGQSAAPEEKKGGKKKKGSGGKTVSSVFLADLTSLMNTLHSTEPHFIRCLVPNNHKQPGGVEPPLIMHQLTCNGVLEGIRICMRGFPNRIIYADFKQRYLILAKGKADEKTEDKKSAGIILENTEGFDPEKYRLGHTKVFFRAGAMALLEEKRDDIVLSLVQYMQGICRAFIARRLFVKKSAQRDMIRVIQRTYRKYLNSRNWQWFIIIQRTKPRIGMANPEEELAILEALAKEKYGAYEEQVETKKKLEKENEAFSEEINNLREKLKNEQGDLSQYEEKLAKISAQKAEFEAQLAENVERLANEEKNKANAQNDIAADEKELANITRDHQDIQAQVEKLQAENTKRDQLNRSLNDQVVHQDEVLSKMNKEKKYIQDRSNTASEELNTAESKVAHLEEIKNKLEQTLDQMDTTLEKEKRAKYNLDKERRALEGDLKMSQGNVSDLDREKRELEQIIMKKDTMLSSMISKMDDEQSNVSRTQRNIKEFQSRVEEMEDELEAERQARAKAERQRSEIVKEFDELTERLDETCVATASQIELNKKRDMEIMKMRKDKEESNIQQESTLASLRKKHQDAVMEIGEQIDQLNKIKMKLEKDKISVKLQLQDTQGAIEHIVHEKALSDKNVKGHEAQLTSLMKKIEENTTVLGDYESQNKRMIQENSNLFTRLEDLLNSASMLQKSKVALANQLEDVKRLCDDEAKERNSLLGRLRNVEHEYDGAREQFEDELQQKQEAARQLQKAMGDANLFKLKYEQEGIARIEELEMSKLKLQSRLTEAGGTMENLNNKLIELDKNKTHIEKNIEEMGHQVAQVHSVFNQAEKKIKLMDKVVADWKKKADGLNNDLNNSQKECRNASSELFRVKNGHAEATAQLEDVFRENKSLSDEIKELMEQISEGGRSIHEIEKQRKMLESEKTELEIALSDAETALEVEENKVLRMTLEANQIRSDIDKRIQEKEEEFEGTKRNHNKAMEQVQGAMEQESKYKAEALRLNKKLTLDTVELDNSLSHADMNNNELHKTIKHMQDKLKDKLAQLEVEQQAKDAAGDHLLNAERRAHAMTNAAEESKSMLDQADKARRQAEQDLSDTTEKLSEVTVQNTSLANSKRKLESDLNDLRAEAEEANNELKATEDRARKCMADAAILGDELRNEQDHAIALEKERKEVEAKLKNLSIQLDDAETNAMKWGRKMAAKLESRCRELEAETDSEQRRCGDAAKNMRKVERGIKEYLFKADEDKKNAERMRTLVERLQQQVRSYKKQIEEAEEIAATNLAKFRRVQQDLAGAEEMAETSEQVLSKVRVKVRGASLARE